ncbi:transposase [Fibrobacter sp.]|uniref:transposase n=1 Tax=Fibrobacter sp. TaxID=35828 RepID=UPI00388DAFC1
MAKVRQISELTQSIAFTEFDFYKDYEESFQKSELGRIRSVLPLREMAVRFGLTDPRPRRKAGRKPYFSPEGKVALVFLKAYTGLSAPKLMEQLNANIHCQIFCGVRISSRTPLTNCKLIDGIASELSNRLKTQGRQEALAEKLFGAKITKQGGDCSYSGNGNRFFCGKRNIETSHFSRKGRKREPTAPASMVRKELARVRATATEGSFGTQKEHYGLKRTNGRIRKTETMIIFFGVHTANAVRLAKRIAEAALSHAA